MRTSNHTRIKFDNWASVRLSISPYLVLASPLTAEGLHSPAGWLWFIGRLNTKLGLHERITEYFIDEKAACAEYDLVFPKDD